jgi:uncharacterized protein YggE
VTNGTAVLRRAPDQAFVVVTVETRAKSPRDVQAQNAALTTTVRSKLGASVPSDAIRTLGYHVEPEVDYVDGRRVPRGYVARNTIEVRIDDIARTGEILDTAIQAGATSVGGVRFELKDRSGAEREALRLAVADARERANAAAAGVGRAVDRVLRIEEHVHDSPLRPMPTAFARAADASVVTPVEPGTIEIRAQAVVTVSMK